MVFKPTKEKSREYNARYRARYPGRVTETCRKWRKKNPDKVQKHELRSRFKKRAKQFGLTSAEYQSLIDGQNNLCAICQRPQTGKRKNLAIDHNHNTGKVRGLLCGFCNTGLGHFMDDPVLLLEAVKYLVERN